MKGWIVTSFRFVLAMYVGTLGEEKGDVGRGEARACVSSCVRLLAID